MPIISFNEKDLARNKIVEPAWYRVRVTKVSEKLSSKGDSTNYWLEGDIIKNADNGDEKFAGVPTPYLWLFNTGAIGKAYGFIAAVTGDEPKLNERYDLNAAEGKELDVFIENELYQGTMQNKINHKYRAAK